MTHEALNNRINNLIHKRGQVLQTTPPEFVLMMLDYYENAINHLIDRLVDLA